MADQAIHISEEWFDYRLRALEGLKAALTTAPGYY
jgi:hypothetical protein